MTLFHFLPPEKEDVERLFHWRRDPRVSQTLVGSPPPGLEAHRAWYRRLEASRRDHLWIIHSGDRRVGQVNISDLDPISRDCEWGYYLGDEAALGLGGLVPPYLYNFLFFNLGLDRLRARVLSNNGDVCALHRRHGYQETGLETEYILRDGAALDLHHFVLTGEAWQTQVRFHRFHAEFPLPSGVKADFAHCARHEVN